MAIHRVSLACERTGPQLHTWNGLELLEHPGRIWADAELPRLSRRGVEEGGRDELQELNLKQPQSQGVTPDPAIERTFQRPLLAHWLAVDVGRRAPWPSFRDSQ